MGARSGRSRDPHGDQEERRPDVAKPPTTPAVERVVDLLFPEKPRAPQPPQPANPFAATLGSIFGNAFPQQSQPAHSACAGRSGARSRCAAEVREAARSDVKRGFYDVRLVEIEIGRSTHRLARRERRVDPSMMGGGDMNEMLGNFLPSGRAANGLPSPTRATIFAD